MSIATRPTRRFQKLADMGDGGDDQNFEQSFSSLAFSYLKEKAPGLLDYMVGFQLVDRDDDKAKAVGLFGFKVGSQWMYAPVFFINGALKGHELLLLKEKKQFVPLDEAWIDFLLAKKPASLGEGVNRNTRQIGVHYPDMFRALQSPHKYAACGTQVIWSDGEKDALRDEAAVIRNRLNGTKEASSNWPDWCAVGMRELAQAQPPDPNSQPILFDVVAAGGLKTAMALKSMLDAYPILQTAISRFYTDEQVKAACDAVKMKPRGTYSFKRKVKRASTGSILDTLHQQSRNKLEIHTFDDPISITLTGEEKEALLRDRILIKDAREDDEVSKHYAAGDVPILTEKRFRNPTESGLYDVLQKDGSLVKCLVVLGPQGPDMNYPFATLVRLEGKKQWVNVHQSYIWVAQEYKGWPEWWNALPDATELSSGYDRYMVLNMDGVGTLPFRCVKSLGKDAQGCNMYEVNFDRYAERSRAGQMTQPGTESYGYDRYCSYTHGERLHLNQPVGTKFRSNMGDVYAPKGSKLLKLSPEKDDSPSDAAYIPSDGESADSPLILGNALDVETCLYAKTAALRVGYDGTAHFVGNQSFPGKRAMIHLVRDHGLRQVHAEEILKAAEVEHKRTGNATEWRIKYADPYGSTPPYLTGGGPYAPSVIDPMQGYDDVFGSAVPAQHEFEQLLNVPDLRTDPQNRDAYDPISPDPMASQIAADAASKGQKDVFDTAMVTALLRNTTDDRMIDEHIPPLMKGLSELGTLLFSYYWHTEQFSDRFGDDEMQELEDSLRNTFSSLGDLVLFLRQRSVEPAPDEAATGIDLNDIADQ